MKSSFAGVHKNNTTGKEEMLPPAQKVLSVYWYNIQNIFQGGESAGRGCWFSSTNVTLAEPDTHHPQMYPSKRKLPQRRKERSNLPVHDMGQERLLTAITMCQLTLGAQGTCYPLRKKRRGGLKTTTTILPPLHCWLLAPDGFWMR